MPDAAIAAVSAFAADPPIPSGGDLGGAWMSMAGALFLVLALLFVGFYLLKRFGPKTGLGVFKRGDLKLEGQLSLGPKRSVVVVRFLNKVLVLGVTESQVNLITEMEAGHEAHEHSDFTDSLEKAQSPDDSS